MKILKVVLFILLILTLIAEISFAVEYKTATYGITEQSDSDIIVIEERSDIKLKDEELEILNLINQYRKENGLAELKPYLQLQKVAKIKAEDIVSNEYFSHTSPTYGTPFELMLDNGVEYKIAGENLAGNISPERAVEAWINSTSHRDNILNEKFQYTGICVVESDVYGSVFVQMFIGI